LADKLFINEMRKIMIAFFIVIFILLCFVVILRLKEDVWLCRNGEWVRHGVPSLPKPEKQCRSLDNFNPF